MENIDLGKSANQIWKESGSNLNFKTWLQREKDKGRFLPNKQLIEFNSFEGEKDSSARELINEVLDESKDDYEKLFRHMLQRTHKSLKDMDANQKSKFFTAVDKAYKAKNEGKLSNLPEELSGDQHKLDTDGDGEIEASDLEKLRNSK